MRLRAAGALALALILLLSALGTWQVMRLRWKRDLIARVEARVHAPPVAPPAPERWAEVTAASDEYRHVRLAGHWLRHHDSWVQAVTALGPGFWLIRPLQQRDGTVVLVNCGLVRQAGSLGSPGAMQEDAEVELTGLLRISEPGGGFLRHNDPAHGRWFSRDVAAIAGAQGLGRVAPYFVDLEAGAAPAAPGSDPQEPVAGLTVIQFPNNHLVYALTWFALAGMVGFAWRRLLREERRGPGKPMRQAHDGEHGRAG